ncbi:hypothetical protein HPB47_020299, partial [Ixodes persulcatus]
VVVNVVDDTDDRHQCTVILEVTVVVNVVDDTDDRHQCTVILERPSDVSPGHGVQLTELFCSLAFTLRGRHRRCNGAVPAVLNPTAALRCLASPAYSTKGVILDDCGPYLVP